MAVFFQKISKSQQLWSKIVGYLKIVVKLQSIVRTNPQKNNYNVIAVYNTVTLLFIPFHFLFINSAFKKSTLSKSNKKTLINGRYLLKAVHTIYLFFYKLLINRLTTNFDDIFRTCNWINYINVWFEKVIAIFIRTTPIVLFMFLPKRSSYLDL